MYTHSKKEKVPDEILQALAAWPSSRQGCIPVADLKHILCGWGEKLDIREVEKLLREANISSTPYVNYSEFVRIISAPAPDY